MFIKMETNSRAEASKSWLANHKDLETQGTLAKRFGKSRTFVSLSLGKKSVTNASEKLVNEIYEYLSKKYGI
ncbi:hypothetical protein [Lentilactobacillus kosonis]|uniref:XRE family transcriptional regulator n=1 Tax=Lentilactobacillus kosonis TaxID=2810561 RepID=A0A401FPL7_9LACO|nr:hypothetical protein [Lentilactobacillus kosonis]GAY74312.1 hypothetical protein NBRC111893_2458 [Lentilactobacillus kosonis]